MSPWTEEQFAAFQRERGTAAFAEAEKAVKPSKYRNVKTVIDGQTFDSKREAQFWQTLKLREKAGEIGDLRRQVPLPLMCPAHDAAAGVLAIVAEYVADYTFIEIKDQSLHVVDAKGKRTRMFDLKKKWLELQSGIVIEIV